MGLFKDLKSHVQKQGKLFGQTMNAYYISANLKDEIGSLQCQLFKDAQWQWRTQESFISGKGGTGEGGRRLLGTIGNFQELKQEENFVGDFESEAVYIHVLRMIALAIDKDYQAFCQQLAKHHQGCLKVVPIKGIQRMWNKV